MTTIMFDQAISFNRKTKAWERHDHEDKLLGTHPTKDDATLAALPDLHNAWATNLITRLGDQFKTRIIRGGVIAATESQTAALDRPHEVIRPLEDGTFAVRGNSDLYYIVKLPPTQSCTCPDWPKAPYTVEPSTGRKKRRCKHIFAVACFLHIKWAGHNSLWDLAHKAVEDRKHTEWTQPLVIWFNGQGLQANITREGFYLYLAISGHKHRLRCAVLSHERMTGRDVWRWEATQYNYDCWVHQVQGGEDSAVSMRARRDTALPVTHKPTSSRLFK